MKTTPLILALYLALTALRLPAWQSDAAIWRSAVQSDPDSPWALNNASMTEPDGWSHLLTLTALQPPTWLPDREKQTYVIGYLNLATWYRMQGQDRLSEAVLVKAVYLAPGIFHR